MCRFECKYNCLTIQTGSYMSGFVKQCVVEPTPGVSVLKLCLVLNLILYGRFNCSCGF